MSWPTPQEYVEAVQNPQYAFDDPDLKSAQPEETKLGLPKVISGQFACVFKFVSPEKSWAVRCFLREFSDSHERYQEISKALEAENFPFTVKFEFIERGIRLKGTWYPIIKMEWLTGQLLGDYIATNISSQSTLLDVANQIANIHAALRRSQIAHGDLQHGNIIVNQGNLFLIDYDGMYVPGLAGKGSHEIGHRHYQHPIRVESDFNANVDTFSVWIIYLSLVMLANDPTLWTKLQGGDDSILLKASDFKEPFSSSAFQLLKNHHNENIQKTGFFIEGLCYGELNELPIFDPAELDAVVPYNATPTPVGMSSWISEWTGKTGVTAGSAATGNGWISQHIALDTPEFDTESQVNIRLLMLLLLASFAAYLLPLFIKGLTPALIALLIQTVIAGPILGILYLTYRKEEAVQEKRNQTSIRNSIANNLSRKLSELTSCKNHIETALAQQKKIAATAALNSAKIDDRLRNKLQKLGNSHDRKRNSPHTQQSTLSHAEDIEKSTIQTRLSGKINALKNKINVINEQIEAALALEFQRHQEIHLSGYLTYYKIRDADLFIIDEMMLTRLEKAGIYTAAEATDQRLASIEGLEPQESTTIKRWRDSLIRRVQNNIPSSLATNIESQIREQFAESIADKEEQIATLEQEMNDQIQAISARYKSKKEPIEFLLCVLESEHKRKCNEARTHAEKELQAARTAAIAATKDVNKHLAKAHSGLRKAENEAKQLRYQLDVSEKKLSAYKQIRFTRWLSHQATILKRA